MVHANCRSNQVELEWTTANETNLSHFEIQKTNDGQSWSVMASLPAVNNNAIRSNYSFIDNHPSETSYYRVVALGINGRNEYSGILRSSCQVKEDFGLWPNPALTNVHINIFTQSTSAAMIQLIDSKGSLVKLLHQNLTKGYNLFEVDMTDLANGTYQCIISWDNGNVKKVIPVIKQR